MNAPFFTIVIPACDVAPYLGDAVGSLKRQSFTDFEAIIFCEESRDGTWEAAGRLVAGDPRFRLIQGPRSGSASDARNYGILKGRGEYLVFLDGDDWLEEEALRTLAEKLRALGPVDLLMLSATLWRDIPGEGVRRGERISDGLPSGTGILSGVELMSTLRGPAELRQATWMRVYSRRFLAEKELLQIPGRRHQDTEWTPRVFFRAARIAVDDYAYYCYRKRPGSVTTRPTARGICDEALNTASLFRFFRENDFPPGLRKQYATFFADFLNSFFAAPKRASFSREERERAFRLLFPDRESRKLYLEVLRHARPGKKLMAPWVVLAWRPWGFALAEWGFRCCYYPLVHGLWGKARGRK